MTGFDLKEIDRIGERLRSGSASEADYGVLDAWRRSFAAALDEVRTFLEVECGYRATPRPIKSNTTVRRKLRERPKMRLSQMRDVAGCRVVVADRAAQRELIARVEERYVGRVRLLDHVSLQPASGYRAVHCEVQIHARRVELQVRTSLQDLWANLSERLTFEIGEHVRTGDGPAEVISELRHWSELIAEYETAQSTVDPRNIMIIRALDLLERFAISPGEWT